MTTDNANPEAREQRLVFGEVADTYDRVRPGYPSDVVDAVMELAGDGVSAVEIGAGTGRATLLFAPRVASLIALEPSPAMAAVAERATAAMESVRVVVSTFEGWDPGPALGTTGLIFAAQAWHWVEQPAGLVRASQTLAPGGVLALFWNRPQPPAEPLASEIQRVYDAVAPDLVAKRPWEQRIAEDMRRLGEAEWVREMTTSTFDHEMTYTSATYGDLMRTQSDHRLIDPAVHDRLLEGITSVIDDAGGKITIPYETLLVLAKRA